MNLAQKKLNDARDDLDIVTRLNDMLLQNEKDWQGKVEASERELHRATLEMQQEKSSLEGDIAELMDRIATLEAAERDAPSGEGEEEEDLALARLNSEAVSTSNTSNTCSNREGTSSGSSTRFTARRRGG